jgi:hypothetical protein
MKYKDNWTTILGYKELTHDWDNVEDFYVQTFLLDQNLL